LSSGDFNCLIRACGLVEADTEKISRIEVECSFALQMKNTIVPAMSVSETSTEEYRKRAARPAQGVGGWRRRKYLFPAGDGTVT
jgi:hypothetical protein